MALIGDIKKDKLKNSLGMSNEEKEKLVTRDKDNSRNRGICMVSELQNITKIVLFVIQSEIQVPGPGAYKP